MTDQQKFLAKYDLSPPRLYVVRVPRTGDGGDEHHEIPNLHDKMMRPIIALLDDHDIPYERVTERPEGYVGSGRTDPSWGDAVDRFNKQLRDGTITDDDGDMFNRADFRLLNLSLSLSTPSELGQSKHRIRRKVFEEFFKEMGVTFELECLTVHSAQACRPVVDFS